MRRKVIQIGNSTQLVSLPRRWAQKHGIKKGDELGIEEQGSKLLVSSESGSSHEVATIKFTTKDKFLTRPIHTLYKLGYDEIVAEFADPEILHLLQDQAENMLGLEVVDHSAKTCTLRNVATAMETEFDSMLRRLFLMLHMMAKDIISAIHEENLEKLDEIQRREKRIDKIAFFCQRILIKKGYKQPQRTSMIYDTVNLIENITDEYRALALHILEDRRKLDKVTVDLLDKLTDLQELTMKLFYSFTLDKLVEFKKERDYITRTARGLLKKNNIKDALALHFIMSINDKSHNITENLSFL